MIAKKAFSYAGSSVVGALLLGIFIILSFNGCNKFGTPDYDLEIIVGAGVQGVPTAGKYTYKDLSLIDYSYTPVDAAHAVEVLINGNRYSSEGSVTMYTHTTLEARLMDIRGKWAITMSFSDTTKTALKFNITLVGTNNSVIEGTFSDDQGPGLGYHGTWKITSGTELSIKYTDWKDYVLTGNASSMSGTWTGDTFDGTWSGSRVTTQ